MRILHATTVPQTLSFLHGLCADFESRGAKVFVLSSPGPELDSFARSEGVDSLSVPMSRGISPVADLLAFVRIWRKLRSIRPDIVHAHTPKAGLLVTLAARAARVPIRVYHLHGLRFLTATGIRRQLLVRAERLACANASGVLVVSQSVRRVAITEGLFNASKGLVLGYGTVNGIDTDKFSPAAVGELGPPTRVAWKIPQDAPVLGFIGRIVTDKGIADLAEAWASLRNSLPTARLVIVGPTDETDPVPTHVMNSLSTDDRVILTGAQHDVLPWLGVFDALVLPSHREGFGQVLLEAAACGRATVAYRIPGVQDAVAEDISGRLVPFRDIAALKRACFELLSDHATAVRLGDNGRARVVKQFRPKDLRELTWSYYSELGRQNHR